jgi:hypothetical protein
MPTSGSTDSIAPAGRFLLLRPMSRRLSMRTPSGLTRSRVLPSASERAEYPMSAAKAAKKSAIGTGAPCTSHTQPMPAKTAARSDVTAARPGCRPAGKKISVPPSGWARTAIPDASSPEGRGAALPRCSASTARVRVGSLS